MRLNKPRILITGEIDETLPDELKLKDWVIDVVPFIRTKIIKTKKVQAAIETVLQLDTTVVFTSRNAVEAVSKHLQKKNPRWNIYCIGNTTRQLTEKFFGKESIIATAGDATALAEKIIAGREIREVYFFCGDKKRNELPQMLKKNNIVVNEIEVYATSIVHHTTGKDYNAILFFSPSAVKGFFSKNQVSEETILFAIGRTTADEIKKFAKNEIMTGNKPGKRDLVEKAIAFFKAQ